MEIKINGSCYGNIDQVCRMLRRTPTYVCRFIMQGFLSLIFSSCCRMQIDVTDKDNNKGAWKELCHVVVYQHIIDLMKVARNSWCVSRSCLYGPTCVTGHDCRRNQAPALIAPKKLSIMIQCPSSPPPKVVKRKLEARTRNIIVINTKIYFGFFINAIT